jgi:HD-GYP domain-containing protein (c-di-GMP phosphodiesterase class II)
MRKRRIRLHALGSELEGRVWESEKALCIGRSPGLDVPLIDGSLSRRHAEILVTEQGWVIRDLGSTNGTFLNGIRVGQVERKLHNGDLLQCGNVVLTISLPGEDGAPEPDTTIEHWQVQGTAQHSWEEALRLVAQDVTRRSQPGEQLVTLLKAAQQIYKATSLDDLLKQSLQDVAGTLGAERGAILLADPGTGKLGVRASYAAGEMRDDESPFSATLAQRCFRQGESLLCNDVRSDPELMRAQSVSRGGMSSIICALLRTPRSHLGVLHVARGPAKDPFTLADLHLADGLAVGMSAGVAGAQMFHEKQRNVFIQTVVALAHTLQLRDPVTSGHSQRVTEYAMLLSDEMGLAADERHRLQVVAPLHDLGKIGVDDCVLRKEGELTPREYEQMKAHSLQGALLLKGIPDLAEAAAVVRSHHERWDGTGYPDGLAGENIPRLARLIAVVDTFDAVTFDAPYRKGLPADAAFAQIGEGKGTQFDPDCVLAFRQARPRIEQRLQHRLQAAARSQDSVSIGG